MRLRDMLDESSVKVGLESLDKDECIDLRWFDTDELIDLIMKGEIKDSKTIIGILFARQSGEI